MTHKLLLLELHRNKRLSSAGIETIRIDFTEKVHWLLGTIGSGKSAILRECTPLSLRVSDSAKGGDYEKGGYKKSIWLLDGEIYTLVSSVGERSAKHSLVRQSDGIELNPAQNVTMFNSTVEQMFGVCKESHRVATGRLKFTTMDVNTRKSIFTSLNRVDFTYALGYYKRLYSLYRDTQGSVRVNTEKLLELKGKASDPDSVALLDAETLKVENSIDKLLSLEMQAVSHAGKDIGSLVRKTVGEINTLHAEFYSMLRTNKSLLVSLGDTASNGFECGVVEALLKDIDAQIDSEHVKYDRYTKELEQLENAARVPLIALEDSYNRALSELLQHRELLKETEWVDTEERVPRLDQVDSVIKQLSKVVESMVGMGDEKIALAEKIVKQRAEAVQKKASLEITENLLLKKMTEITMSHAKGAEMVCPNCHTHFDCMVADQRLVRAKEEHEALVIDLKGLREILGDTEDTAVEYQAHLDGIGLYKDTIARLPIYHRVWSRVGPDIRSMPTTVMDYMLRYRSEVEHVEKDTMLSLQVSDTKKQLDAARNSSTVDVKALTDGIKRRAEVLEGLYAKREVRIADLTTLKSRLSLSRRIEEKIVRAQALKSDLESMVRDEHTLMLKDTVGSMLRDLKLSLSELQKTKQESTAVSSLILNLESSIESDKESLSYLGKALKVLSPSEGLIAKGMTGFVNHFTGLMNNIINRMMNYPMQLKPLVPDSESFELKYMFPVELNGGATEDVSECSTGQSEIIDLAFSIVYLSMKGLGKGPLLLDEFGAHLDVKHKKKVCDAIRTVLDVTDFSQLVMVSHMTAGFGEVSDSNVTVLCGANIELPEHVLSNATTMITRY